MTGTMQKSQIAILGNIQYSSEEKNKTDEAANSVQAQVKRIEV